jgi:hypothetical protein
MDYQRLLEKYNDMVLISTLILPEHTEDVVKEIGKAMNIPIELKQLVSAVESSSTSGENKVCCFEREREFIYIDCHKPQDLHQIIIRCLNSKKEDLYDSLYKWVRLRQEAYGQPISKEIIDWMHPDKRYEKVKNPLLSSLQFNRLIDDTIDY